MIQNQHHRLRLLRLRLIRSLIHRVQIQIRPRHLLLRLRRDWMRMTKTTRQCILLAFIGHLLTFVPFLLAKYFHKWTYGNADWFLLRSFHYPRARYWYFKDTTDNILLGIAWLIGIKISVNYSDVLFVVLFVFLGYHVINIILYWVDYNTEFWAYADMIWTAAILIKAGVFPYRPEKFAKIRSLF